MPQMKKYLFTPGPAPVPPEVLLEMARPIIHHRTPEFSAALDQARERMKPLYGTSERSHSGLVQRHWCDGSCGDQSAAAGRACDLRQRRQIRRAMGQTALDFRHDRARGPRRMGPRRTARANRGCVQGVSRVARRARAGQRNVHLRDTSSGRDRRSQPQARGDARSSMASLRSASSNRKWTHGASTRS